jgi:hypothetical protein
MADRIPAAQRPKKSDTARLSQAQRRGQTMTETMTEVAVGGMLAFLLVREAFQFVIKIRDKAMSPNGKRPTTDKVKSIQNGVDAVLSRLDRIVERLEDIGETLRVTKKITVVTGEKTDRLGRQTEAIEKTVNEIALAHKRRTDSQPLIP